MLPEYRDETPTKGLFLLLHYSLMRELWDWLVILLCIYTAILVPYNITFQSEGFLVLDVIIDVIFFFDIVLNFRTTYATDSGKLVVDQKNIALLYLKTWFFIDFISFLPLEIYFYGDEGNSSLVSELKTRRFSLNINMVLLEPPCSPTQDPSAVTPGPNYSESRLEETFNVWDFCPGCAHVVIQSCFTLAGLYLGGDWASWGSPQLVLSSC